ncbi:MAG: hypothetical protein U0234_12375 [Sandaracinus sp.]
MSQIHTIVRVATGGEESSSILPTVAVPDEIRVALRDVADALVAQEHSTLDASHEVAGVVDALLDRALRLFGELLVRDDPTGDVAFMARAELRPFRERLALASGDAERLDEARRALRRIARTLSALDIAMNGAEEGGVTSELMLAQSLTTRRAYARFRRAVLRVALPLASADDARRALERARVHLAMLVRSDAYPIARSHDRAQIDALAARVALASAGGAEPVEVARLWQDVEGLARLTADVSRRHELVAHDTALVAHATAALAGARSIEPRLRAKLERLAGLDEDTDRLLDEGDWDLDAWRTVLDALHERLVRPASGRFAVLREGSR